jgi:hypothetical protein
MNLQFKVPEWYDPEGNVIERLYATEGDVYEAWDVFRGEKIPCIIGYKFVGMGAVDAKWCRKVRFGKDGLDEDNHLLIDPDSKYQYHKISRIARIGRTVQKFDKVEYEYNLFTWVVYDIFDDKVKATNGIEYRIFDKDKITIIESLTPPKTIKEQIKCILNKIAHTKIMRAITGLFVG